MQARVLTIMSALLLGLLLATAAPLLAQQAPPPPSEPANPPTVVPSPPVPVPPAAAAAPPKAPSVVLPPEVLEPIARLSRSVETAEKSIKHLKNSKANCRGCAPRSNASSMNRLRPRKACARNLPRSKVRSRSSVPRRPRINRLNPPLLRPSGRV